MIETDGIRSDRSRFHVRVLRRSTESSARRTQLPNSLEPSRSG
ncbi:hypothetical protein SLEP1_g37177 [Rubroshorea leprosula]|uniref:Uncharacterized protein n=1 Tax=Rubroshorea leprosula TaxID=152421 RepID=A0AAV5KU30_9ROSI|nr:hypothetical protein SLEP1_g37177 [Rubroshorea leprosula]